MILSALIAVWLKNLQCCFCNKTAAALSRCLSNFRVIWSLQHPISRLRDFTRFGGEASHHLVNRGPGITDKTSDVPLEIAQRDNTNLADVFHMTFDFCNSQRFSLTNPMCWNGGLNWSFNHVNDLNTFYTLFHYGDVTMSVMASSQRSRGPVPRTSAEGWHIWSRVPDVFSSWLDVWNCNSKYFKYSWRRLPNVNFKAPLRRFGGVQLKDLENTF